MAQVFGSNPSGLHNPHSFCVVSHARRPCVWRCFTCCIAVDCISFSSFIFVAVTAGSGVREAGSGLSSWKQVSASCTPNEQHMPSLLGSDGRNLCQQLSPGPCSKPTLCPAPRACSCSCSCSCTSWPAWRMENSNYA